MKNEIVFKKQVKVLRARGKTYSEIMTELGIKLPKSTISNWCRGVVLPKWYQAKVEKLNKKNLTLGQKIAQVSNQIKREKFLQGITNKNHNIASKIKSDKDVLRALLSILYLGEGSKWKSHSGMILGSSDPLIIKLYLKLLELCYDLKPKTLKCRISYRADQDINRLQSYWSKITGIQLKNFYKTIPDPRTIGKPTKKKNYMGVCVINGGSSAIQLELEKISEIISMGL